MASYSLKDLIYLMERLRSPEGGCPWDLEQTYATIVPHTLEEAYEVADTIEREDWSHLEDELGDLLFQVVFYTQLGREDGRFSMDSVIQGLCEKLVRRHPHVFPTGELYSDSSEVAIEVSAVNQQWEAIKQQERDKKERARILDEIPLSLPAMSRAVKLTKRASKVGFDWEDASGVLDKIEEELLELREAMAMGNAQEAKAEIRAELGDLIFAMANLARKLDVDPETAVRETNSKFERRFNYVEDQVLASRKDWQAYDLQQLDLWWDESKEKGL